jgi:alpha-mannosidase
MGQQELINMVMDKKALRQALGMINEGNVAGMVITHFDLQQQGAKANIHAVISDHGSVSREEWQKGLAKVEASLADPTVEEYLIQAHSDPEISLSFIANDVPGHGYKAYWIRGMAQEHAKLSQPLKLNWFVKAVLPASKRISRYPLFSRLIRGKGKKHSNPPYQIENEYFTVEASASDGTLSITDKRNHQAYHGFNRFIDGGDCGDLYNYCPPRSDKTITATLKSIEYETGSTDQQMQVRYQMIVPRRLAEDRKSRSHQTIILKIASKITVIPGVPRIDIITQVDNQACDHRLRVQFPVPFEALNAWHDGHFEIVPRPVGLPQFDASWEEPPRPEVPQREFSSITDGQASLTIANRGLPEVEILKNQSGNAEIALTLLRCVGWLSRDDITTRKGHAGPLGVETPEAQMPGEHIFAYAIIPGNDDWRQSIQPARAFNAPLHAIETSTHQGMLNPNCSMVENLNPDFNITAIKLAEADASLIVRGYNSQPTPINVPINLWKAFRRAQLVNLDESIISDIPISQNGMINVQVGPCKIVTFRFSD